MMGYDAKILADSISPAGHRLTTFEVTFPRIVLAEFNTHRVFSRNSASSRAIPVEKMIRRVENDPFLPVSWGKNQKGMQAEAEFSDAERTGIDLAWREFSRQAIMHAEELLSVGVHKQITNRLLEPWLWHTVIVSATEWGNFFNLRDNKMAQPEIHKAADMMHQLYKASAPSTINYGDWHLPLVPPDEAFNISVVDGQAAITAAKICSGRCARVSYLTHDGKRDHAADIGLAESLVANGHMSPLEHPARPMTEDELVMFEQPVREWRAGKWIETGEFTYFLGNVQGWVQWRKMLPGEADIHTHRGTTA
jgi:thymidylate synthase ThyX